MRYAARAVRSASTTAIWSCSPAGSCAHFASQLPAAVALPQETDASGKPIAECMQFFDGYTWGPVHLADMQVAGETAHGLPIQVIDPAYASIPSDCTNVGAAKNTRGTLAANGILGIGVFLHDCGANCVAKAISGTYYTCPGGTCTSSRMAEALQVANPIPYFATNNNGVIVQLPGVSASGAQSTTGSLIFGIGTQANNALGGARVLPTNILFRFSAEGAKKSPPKPAG
jgi:hypothetical protein